MAIIHAITLVVLRNTLSVGAGEGIDSTLQGWGLIGGVLHTGLLVRSQLHAIRAATHPLEVGHRETKVAAVSIGISCSVTIVSTWGVEKRSKWKQVIEEDVRSHNKNHGNTSRTVLTGLGIGIKRLDVHDVADSPPDDDHLSTIGFPNTYNGTQPPISVICIIWTE